MNNCIHTQRPIAATWLLDITTEHTGWWIAWRGAGCEVVLGSGWICDGTSWHGKMDLIGRQSVTAVCLCLCPFSKGKSGRCKAPWHSLKRLYAAIRGEKKDKDAYAGINGWFVPYGAGKCDKNPPVFVSLSSARLSSIKAFKAFSRCVLVTSVQKGRWLFRKSLFIYLLRVRYGARGSCKTGTLTSLWRAQRGGNRKKASTSQFEYRIYVALQPLPGENNGTTFSFKWIGKSDLCTFLISW